LTLYRTWPNNTVLYYIMYDKAYNCLNQLLIRSLLDYFCLKDKFIGLKDNEPFKAIK
jgi:hypothetical protein